MYIYIQYQQQDIIYAYTVQATMQLRILIAKYQYLILTGMLLKFVLKFADPGLTYIEGSAYISPNSCMHIQCFNIREFVLPIAASYNHFIKFHRNIKFLSLQKYIYNIATIMLKSLMYHSYNLSMYTYLYCNCDNSFDRMLHAYL